MSVPNLKLPWRLTISLDDSPEKLALLPPLDLPPRCGVLMILPWYLRQRSDRVRLLAALRVCDPQRWPLTHQHLCEQFYRLESGRIDKAF